MFAGFTDKAEPSIQDVKMGIQRGNLISQKTGVFLFSGNTF